MIKIMHVMTDVQFGGAGSWLMNLVSAIDYKKFQVYVVVPKKSILVTYLSSYPLEVIEAEGLDGKSLSLKGIIALSKIMNKIEPSIVHTHACLSARIVAKMQGRHILFTKHCMENNTAAGLKLLLKKGLNGFLTHRVMAVSDAVAKDMEIVFPEEIDVDTVYSGVKPLKQLSEDEKAEVKKNLGIQPDELVVGIVARLTKVKGHETFIEGANIVAQAKKNVKFLIIGGGPRDAELKELVASKESLHNKVIFTGYTNEVEKYMNIMDINVITSTYEALCLSILEGMSLGVPAVVSNTGGLPEVVEDHKSGLLFPVGNAVQLSLRMVELLADKKKREAFGKRGKEIAEEKFSTKKMANTIEGIYESLNKEKRKVIVDKKGKLFGKANIIDIAIITLVVAVGIFGYAKFIAPKNMGSAVDEMTYKIEIQNCPASIAEMIAVNGYIREGVKGNNLGTIVDYEVKTAKTITASVGTTTFVNADIPGRVDVTFSVKSPYVIKGGNILVDGMPVKVGTKTFVQGKGFAGIGYIIDIPKID